MSFYALQKPEGLFEFAWSPAGAHVCICACILFTQRQTETTPHRAGNISPSQRTALLEYTARRTSPDIRNLRKDSWKGERQG